MKVWAVLGGILNDIHVSVKTVDCKQPYTAGIFQTVDPGHSTNNHRISKPENSDVSFLYNLFLQKMDLLRYPCPIYGDIKIITRNIRCIVDIIFLIVKYNFILISS